MLASRLKETSSRLLVIALILLIQQTTFTHQEAQSFSQLAANRRFFTGSKGSGVGSSYGAPNSGYGAPSQKPSYNSPKPSYNTAKPSYNPKPSYGGGGGKGKKGGLKFKTVDILVPDIDLPNPLDFKIGVLRSKGRIASGLLHAKAGILRAGANLLAKKANSLDKAAQAIPGFKAKLIKSLKKGFGKGGSDGGYGGGGGSGKGGGLFNKGKGGGGGGGGKGGGSYGAPQGHGNSGYGAPQGHGTSGYGAPQGPNSGYGAPQAPPVSSGYGAPQGPVVSSGYGAPQGPVVNSGYGAPQSSVNDGYGAPQGPVVNSGYGAPQGAGVNSGYGSSQGIGVNSAGHGASISSGYNAGLSVPVSNSYGNSGSNFGGVVNSNGGFLSSPVDSYGNTISSGHASSGGIITSNNHGGIRTTSNNNNFLTNSNVAQDSYGSPLGSTISTGQSSFVSGGSPNVNQDSYGSPVSSVITSNQSSGNSNIHVGSTSSAIAPSDNNYSNIGSTSTLQVNPRRNDNSIGSLQDAVNQFAVDTGVSENGATGFSEKLVIEEGRSCQSEEPLRNLLEDIFMGNELIPDVIDSAPIFPLELTFKTVRTYPGMRLTAESTRVKPRLSWPADPNALYTVVVSNLDINSRRNRTLSEFWHWFVADVPGNSLDEGKVIFDLLHPLVLPEGDGDHRFGYFVFKQPGKSDYSGEGGPTDSCSPEMSNGRGPFRSTKNFQQKYGLELSAATFIIVDYSDASMEIACDWQKCIGDTISLVNPLRCQK